VSRRERERRYISEYMLETYPEGNYQLNVPLGPIPPEMVNQYGIAKAAAMFRPTRLRVDAVASTSSYYVLIEAKLRSFKDGIGDLLTYSPLAPQTPDLPLYRGQQFKLRLVVPYDLPWLRDITGANNIEYAIFNQPWIAEYARERLNYFTAEYRNARAEKLRLREILGVD